MGLGYLLLLLLLLRRRRRLLRLLRRRSVVQRAGDRAPVEAAGQAVVLLGHGHLDDLGHVGDRGHVHRLRPQAERVRVRVSIGARVRVGL